VNILPHTDAANQTGKVGSHESQDHYYSRNVGHTLQSPCTAVGENSLQPSYDASDQIMRGGT